MIWIYYGFSQNFERRLFASSRLSVCLSVCPHGTIRLPLDRFLLNLKLENFQTYVEKIQTSLTSDKNNGYFTWRPIHIFDNISLTSSQNEKRFRQNLYGKSEHTSDVQ
jgi:hypothetical protein